MNYEKITVESLSEYVFEKSGFKINKQDLETQINHLVSKAVVQEKEKNNLNENDLIIFSKWVEDKFYSHRLHIIPEDLVKFYKENRTSITDQYSS